MLGKLVTAIWRTLTLIFVVVLLAVFIGVPLVVYFGVFYQAPPTVAKRAALVWMPHGTLVEQPPSGLGAVISDRLDAQRGPSVVVRLIAALDTARDDDRIKKAYLKLDDLAGAQPGQLQDLVAAIDRFRQSGKAVVAWADSYDQARFELASRADRVVVDPLGGVVLAGYGVYRDYFAGAIEDLGIKIHVFRHGKYKSFAEPFMRDDMSPAAKKANRAWTDSLWQTYLKIVAGRRAIAPQAVNAYAQNYPSRLVQAGGNGARLAAGAGLVDDVAPWSAAAGDLADAAHDDSSKQALQPISSGDYLAATAAERGDNAGGDVIARIVVAGEITGATDQGSAVDDATIGRLFARARRDDSIKAVLLRIDSPGGAIAPSEAIRRQVVATQKAGKPVVVSMAGVAASGGYWLAMNAAQIWAQPSTITGSIGVFGIFPTFNEPLNDLGVRVDGVGTTPLAGALRVDRPLSAAGRKLLRSSIGYAYAQFVNKVAQARGMKLDAVQEHAQGRVWSGRAAKRIGLVDALGGPVAASRAAADLAGLKDHKYSVETLAPPSSWDSALESLFSAHAVASFWPHWIARATRAETVDWLRQHLGDPGGRYARCFCRVTTAAHRAAQ